MKRKWDVKIPSIEYGYDPGDFFISGLFFCKAAVSQQDIAG